MGQSRNSTGFKRKLPDRTKDQHSSKKSRLDKPTTSHKFKSQSKSNSKHRDREHQPSDRSDLDDDDDDDDNNNLSEDSEEGGATLDKDEAKPNSDNPSNGNGKSFERGQNSRESHQKQKQLAQERKANKPLADESQRLKKIWERLRRKSHVPKDERDKLVEELFSIVSGRIREFALKHDTVRVVQTAIKYANAERRKMIALELKGTYSQLAESKYAKFLIAKLMVEGDEEVRNQIVPDFYGKVRKTINHPEASWILDDIYRKLASKEQKAILLREWYGPEFAILRDSAPGAEQETADLATILKDQPSKRGTTMKYLLDLTNQLIQKEMVGFTMLHDAMVQYFLNLVPGSSEQKEYMETIKGDEGGDLLQNMAFTASGARLLCLLLAYGTAKDRKQILKALKTQGTTFQAMAMDQHGHLVILAIYDVVDDTVLTAKSIFPELLGKDDEKAALDLPLLANDLNGRLTIRYLFEGTSRALFGPGCAADLAVLPEVHEIRKTTSKKDPEVRRKELVAALSPALLAGVENNAAGLLETGFGCQMLVEVLLGAVGEKGDALRAVAETAGGDPDATVSSPGHGEAIEAEKGQHISHTPHGGRMFKNLIAGGHFDRTTKQVVPVDPPLHFADLLFPVIQDFVVQWATGPSSFVVVALMEAADFGGKDELRGVLRRERKVLKRAATEVTREQRERRVEGGKNGDKGKKEGKAKGKKMEERKVGNIGTKILLEML